MLSLPVRGRRLHGADATMATQGGYEEWADTRLVAAATRPVCSVAMAGYEYWVTGVGEIKMLRRRRWFPSGPVGDGAQQDQRRPPWVPAGMPFRRRYDWLASEGVLWASGTTRLPTRACVERELRAICQIERRPATKPWRWTSRGLQRRRTYQAQPTPGPWTRGAETKGCRQRTPTRTPPTGSPAPTCGRSCSPPS